MSPFNTFEKSAVNRRQFIADILKSALGVSATLSGYRGLVRPLMKDLSHEVGSSNIVRGAAFGPTKKPAVGPGDLSAWGKARDAAQQAKLPEAKANVAGLRAMSPTGQEESLRRYLKTEATTGAVQGGVIGGAFGAARKPVMNWLEKLLLQKP